MVATVLVVATAFLLGTVVVMIGVNQQADAAAKKVAINEKGKPARVVEVQDEDDDDDISVEVTKKKKNGGTVEGPVEVKIKLNSSRSGDSSR